jgi:hypothetical protein
MVELRSGVTAFVLLIVVLSLLAAALVTTALLWWLGEWNSYGGSLTFRIVWGACLATFLAMILTQAAIYGWQFRRYFGRAEPGQTPTEPAAPPPPPWPKSGKASFSITIILVSLTGAAVVASMVLWVLSDLMSEPALRWSVGGVWAAWWLGVLATVLTRVAHFGVQRKKAVQGGRNDEPTESPPRESP